MHSARTHTFTKGHPYKSNASLSLARLFANEIAGALRALRPFLFYFLVIFLSLFFCYEAITIIIVFPSLYSRSNVCVDVTE